MSRAWRTIRTVLLVVAGLYALAALGMFVVQRRIVFVPDTSRPDVATAHVPGLREIELITASGLWLHAWFLPPPPGRAVVAFFHGNGGNLGDRINWIQALAAARYGLLLPEYPGFGGNPGSPSEEGFAETADAALAWLDANLVGVRIVIYGESIGSAVAVRAAATREGAGRATAGMILESPFSSITDIGRRQFPWLPVALLLRDQFDCIARIPFIHTPLLVLQGARDTLVPPALGQRLFAAANEPKRLWVAPEGRHDTLGQNGAMPVIFGFLDRM